MAEFDLFEPKAKTTTMKKSNYQFILQSHVECSKDLFYQIYRKCNVKTPKVLRNFQHVKTCDDFHSIDLLDRRDLLDPTDFSDFGDLLDPGDIFDPADLFD